MKRSVLFIAATLSIYSAYAQVANTDSLTNEPLNSSANIIAGNSSKRITLGAYAQLDYNQPFGDTVRHNGKLDVHRLILFLGYKFSDRAHFVAEIEIEHVKEVYAEQAFLNYRLDNKGLLNFRTGLLLIPMGIINEYHEPTTYNGVERPNLEAMIVPTTWRELGAGFAGKFDNASLRYQLYLVNGPTSYDGGGKFRGVDGIRKGRQKGAESIISSPNIASKLDYYGIKGMKLGLSGYFGNSQSSLFDGVDESDLNAMWAARASEVGIAMGGFDVRYNIKALQVRGQLIYCSLSGTNAYNSLTSSDLGSSMMGYYGELGYDIMSLIKKDSEHNLILFGRYENYNTHFTIDDATLKNDAYNRTDITAGFGYKVAPGAVFKIDYQLLSNAAGGKLNQFNFGVGIWF